MFVQRKDPDKEDKPKTKKPKKKRKKLAVPKEILADTEEKKTEN